MLKALLRKQFLELNAFYFQNKKTRKHRSKTGTVLFILLFILIFIGLGAAFFGVSDMLSDAFILLEQSWMYFAVMGLMAIILGVLGSVFSTYAALYHAKDNELLLSMPIPPAKILFVRMVGVYAMGLLYEAIVLVPAVLVYWIKTPSTLCTILFPILLILIIGFFVLTLTCLLGWIVAMISSKLKNKSIITVLLSLVFFAVYYYLCFHINSMLSAIVENSATIGTTIKNAAYPLYLLGRAGEGDIQSMLLFSAFVAILFAIAYVILSKTFLKIATKKEIVTNVTYKEKSLKVSGVDAALFQKEWKRFSSSATYMLNCALGTIFMPIIAIVLLIFMPKIQEILTVLEFSHDFLSVLAAVVVCMLVSMNDITAPSISMEGKNIWILQTLPVNTSKIFDAKQRLHLVLTVPPAVFLVICLSIVIGMDLSATILAAVLAIGFAMFFSAMGLVINLKKPNLNWINETAAVKQSIGVLICLLGGWFICIIFGIIGYFAIHYIEAYQFFIIFLIIFTLLARVLNRWLQTKGTEIFERL